MADENYLTTGSDTLNSILQAKYFQLPVADKKNIALNILFTNPALAISLLPVKFWAKPQDLTLQEVGEVLNKKINSVMLISIPVNSSLIPRFNSDFCSNLYNFAPAIANPPEEKRHHVISAKTLKKYAPTLAKNLGLGPIKMLLIEANELNIGSVDFLADIEVSFHKFLTYLLAKFEVKMIEGEKFFIVSGSKKINGILGELFRGTENDARVISMGLGSMAAKNILVKGVPGAIILIASIDIVEHCFNNTSTADLLASLGVDLPAAAITAAAGAAAPFLAGAFAAGLLPVLVVGVGIVVIGVFIGYSAMYFMGLAGYNKNSIQDFVIKHHIDTFVDRATHSWEQYNYERFTTRNYGAKI